VDFEDLMNQRRDYREIEMNSCPYST